ncbi:MAG: hypothetical protein RR052_06530 [Oscillospiraceae bacterium]
MKNSMLKIKRSVAVVIIAMMCSVPCFANKITQSNIGVGLMEMFKDLGTFGMIVAPIIAGCVCVYFLIRRAIADEQDGKMWTKRMMISLVCGVSVFLISGVFSIIGSYFGKTVYIGF